MSGMGVGSSSRWRWWLVLWVMVAGLWAVGEPDPSWAKDPADEAVDVVEVSADGGVGPVTTHHCSDRRHRSDETCRACPDFTEMWRGGQCQPKIEPGTGDPPCPVGQLYYASYEGCRDVTCPRGPPHNMRVRDSDGYCLPAFPTTTPPPPTTTPPPPPPGAPRDVSVTAGLGSLTVNWRPAASGGEPDGWEVHYSYRAGVGPAAQTDSGVHTVDGEDVPAEGATLENLMPGKPYTVKVRATKGTVTGPFSSTVTATTLAPAVTLVGLEVTQGLQDWEGSIKLVKGKETVVRAFLEPFSGQDTTVSLRLEAVRKHGSSETVVATAYPANASRSFWEPSLGMRVAEFTARPDPAGRRRELDASANFVLSDSRWFGSQNYVENGYYSITYRLVVVGDDIICEEAINPDNTCEASLSFKAVKQPRVRMVGISTPASQVPFNTITPTRDDLIEQARRIESLMPIPKLEYELRTLDVTIGPVPDDLDEFRQYLTDLLAKMLYVRANDNSKLAYLGVMNGGSGGQSRGVLANAAVWLTAGATSADALHDRRNTGSHEFGHVVGERHAAYKHITKTPFSVQTEMRTICSGPTAKKVGTTSEIEPYPHLLEVTAIRRDANNNPIEKQENWAALGPIGSTATANTEMWGLDTRFARSGPDDLAVINPEEVFSIMSYCEPNTYLKNSPNSQGRWVDAYHHPKFIKNINDIDWDLGPDQTSGGHRAANRLLYLGGYITSPAESPGATGESAASGLTTTALPLLTLPPGSRLGTRSGDYTLEFLDGDGNVLSSVSFGTYTVADDGPGGGASEVWAVPVAEPSGWASYRISKPPASGAGGAEGSSSSRTVLVEVSRSANAPAVSVTAPIAGQVLSGDEVTFSWTGSDVDGDDLSYTVQYSSDGGASYETIAVGYESSSLTLDRASLAGSATAKVKVTAADGTRTASAESAVFTVSQNRPEVFIHSPAANLISGSGALVLDATAYDTEDGLLNPSAVQWSSDSVGNLGTGGYVVIYPEELEPGPHRLTATATDSTGATGTAEVFWFNPIPLVWSPPSAPAGVIATGGIRSITVSWTALAASLTSDYYQYRYRPVSGEWTEWAGLPGVREHTITGLSSNTAYEIELRTVTITDISDPVRVTATTAATLPAAPAGLTAAGGDGWVDLGWDHPADSSVTGYQFREKPTFDDDWWCWNSIWNGGAETTSHRVQTLSGGTDYRIQVRARNALGAGPAAEASAATAAAASAGTAPAAPGGLTGTGGDRSISLSWDNPGDPTIIEYQFREKTDNETGWRCWRRINKSTAATTSHTMAGITNDIRYRIQIRAVNPTGAGPTSETTATPSPGP